jgi:hypothetical protein
VDATLLLLIIALIVVIVLFVVTLRAGAANTRRAAAANNARQEADRQAIAAPQSQPQAQDAGAHRAQDAVAKQDAAGGQETRQLLADTSRGDAPQAQTFAPSQANDAPLAQASTIGQQVRPQTTDAAPVIGQQVAAPAMAIAESAPTSDSVGDGDAAALGAHATPKTIAIERTDSANPAVAPLSSDEAQASVGAVDTGAALELAGPPATRTGAVMLSVTPQRLPYRLAELLGEQRGLEEAITIAHRRIDDIELGPDPGGADNRVRLTVLRQDLSQKQERLREILFLQDGYRWLQQHMAPERTPSES